MRIFEGAHGQGRTLTTGIQECISEGRSFDHSGNIRKGHPDVGFTHAPGVDRGSGRGVPHKIFFQRSDAVQYGWRYDRCYRKKITGMLLRTVILNEMKCSEESHHDVNTITIQQYNNL
ncbi:MAG: hypothetical protein JWO44_2085 [Bacteroidetes bacterium]|nr:hypothetical protein [Bacteroidota bacterium]